MIPEERLSTEPVQSAFLGARANANIGPLLDFEDGGVALQDPSEGLQFQVWKCYRVERNDGADHDIVAEDEAGNTTVLYTGADITELSLSFDQNMNTVLAFVEDGQAKLRWFDTQASAMVVTELDADVRTPRVSLDDKHPLGLPDSDVILAYRRSDDLYFRAQSDRYGVEYLLQEGGITDLEKVGMNIGNRFQFKFQDDIVTIHRMDRQYWLHWAKSELEGKAVEVDVARGPILGDETERTYFTGTGAPRVTNISKAIGSCNEEYPCDSLLMGVPAPENAPTVSVNVPDVDEGSLVLTNAGAEAGDTSGWTIVEGGFEAVQSGDGGNISPSAGTYFFGGGSAAATEAIQRLDAEDNAIAVGSTLRLTWDQNGDGTDTARMGFRFRDSNLDLIGEEDMADFTAETGGWASRTHSAIVPDNTASVDVVQQFEREGGTEIIAYIDEIALFRQSTTVSFACDNFEGWDFDDFIPADEFSLFGDSANIEIDDAVGRPAPCFRLASFYYKEVSVYRPFQFDKTPKAVIDVDIMRSGGGGSPTSIRLGNDANGAGPALRQWYDSSFRFETARDWRDLDNVAISVYEDAMIPMDEWLHVNIVVEPVQGGKKNVAVTITKKDTGELVFSESEDMEFLGDQFGFSVHAAGDENTLRLLYVDNISVNLAPDTADPGRELLESEFTAYVYTLVNELGEEGAPSPASRSVQKSEAAEIAVTTDTTATAGYGVTKKRIYRTVTNADGSQFLFVDEIPLNQALLTDGLANNALGEPLQSQEWDLPPDDMLGIIALPNGIMMGFAGNQVVPSVQNRPHAYPVGFRLATDYPIVGIGAIDATAVVVTERNPYLVQGTTPDQLGMQQLELPQGCVSKRSMVTLNSLGVVYASPDGLVAVAGNGQTRIVTESLFSRREWQALNPSTIHAVAHDDRYFGWYIDKEGNAGGFILDVAGEDAFGFVPLDFYAEAAYSDALTDTLYMSIGGQINVWEGGTGKLKYVWRSALYQLPYPASFAHAQVRAADYSDLKFRVYADGALIRDGAVTSVDDFVLPSVDAAREWEIELEGTSRVQRVEIAEDSEELT
ncbi:hypothetical protein [Algiphilus aromaticivorans]|uniref:hypothetical protein n=1 Tax=Algiphilus aromaticivorans TaxID=382454 RepID=UPI0005C2518C|nr:hypothetical protein [Algiphilus aromaticivorans]